MRKSLTSRFRVAAILLSHGLSLTAGLAVARDADRPLPAFSEVRQAVLRHFERQADFRPTDLITRDQVEPLLAKLQGMGLPLTDAKQILEMVPAKGDFLVEQLGTPAGRSFMRRAAVYPNAYDRLDRLSRMPLGQQTVRDLIKGPGGEKMIEYMTKAPGGLELGKMLSNCPDGQHFNTPTGRIYTVEMLLARLQESYAAALKKSRG